MELIHEWTTIERTYKYSNNAEKDIHEKIMISQGFRVTKQPDFMEQKMVVTYQKRIINDNVARF